MEPKYFWVRQSSNGSKWVTTGFYSFAEAYTVNNHDWWCSKPLYPLITNEDLDEAQKLSRQKK